MIRYLKAAWRKVLEFLLLTDDAFDFMGAKPRPKEDPEDELDRVMYDQSTDPTPEEELKASQQGYEV